MVNIKDKVVFCYKSSDDLRIEWPGGVGHCLGVMVPTGTGRKIIRWHCVASLIDRFPELLGETTTCR